MLSVKQMAVTHQIYMHRRPDGLPTSGNFTRRPAREKLYTNDLQEVHAKQPFEEASLSLDEVREPMAWFSGGEAGGVFNASAKLLRVESKILTRLGCTQSLLLFGNIGPFVLT